MLDQRTIEASPVIAQLGLQPRLTRLIVFIERPFDHIHKQFFIFV
jgi:hypothetical protein